MCASPGTTLPSLPPPRPSKPPEPPDHPRAGPLVNPAWCIWISKFLQRNMEHSQGQDGRAG